MVFRAAGSALSGSVLVVDDSPVIVAIMTDILGQLDVPGDSVATATSESDGLRIAEDATPDVAFVDMELGAGSGEVVMSAILKRKPGAKVVLMTGLGREDPRIVQATSMGAFAFLRKPLRREAVRLVLEEIEQETGSQGRIR